MTQTDFNIALTLLREGNSDMMRDLYPKLEPIFDLIEEQSKKIEELEEKIIEDLEEKIEELEDVIMEEGHP